MDKALLTEMVKDRLTACGGEWCYQRSDPSGRDFVELIPYRYITLDELGGIIESIIDDAIIEGINLHADYDEIEDFCLYEINL